MILISKNKIGNITCLILIVLFLTTSCEKWLEEKPQSLYTSENYFKTVDEAFKAILGVYEIMSDQKTYGYNTSLLFDITNDIGQMEASSATSSINRVFAHYNFQPDHIYLEEAWMMYYKGIDRANLVISKIPQMDLFHNGAESEKKELKRLIAEAKFLRGLYYFDLVRFFGDVPFKTEYTKAEDDHKLPRTDREIIYDQIIKDMKEAIDDIPEVSAKSIDERVSKGAVKGILARVYLGRAGYSLRQNGVRERPSNYLDYYREVARLTGEVIESGEHTLNPSYERIFKNYCELTLEPKESMFEVAFFNIAGNRENSSYIGQWNSNPVAAGGPYVRTSSFYRALPNLFVKFSTSDLRRDVAIARYGINATGGIADNSGAGSSSRWTPGKWRRDWQDNSKILNLNNSNLNWVLLRYSDVLLMKSEAENELHADPIDNPDIYKYINMVRRRGFGVDINSQTPTIADLPPGLSKGQFFERIKLERAFELCYEGFRKFDLIRWNILGESIRQARVEATAYRANYPYIAHTYFVDNKHELYPIPSDEIDINPNLLPNNPQY